MKKLNEIKRKQKEWKRVLSDKYKNSFHMIDERNFNLEKLDLDLEDAIFKSKLENFLNNNNVSMFHIYEIKFLHKSMIGMSYETLGIYKKYKKFLKKCIY